MLMEASIFLARSQTVSTEGWSPESSNTFRMTLRWSVILRPAWEHFCNSFDIESLVIYGFL